MRRFVTILACVLLLIFTVLPALPVVAENNLLANPSVETAASADAPANWHADRWGTNQTSLTYASTGHSGNRSLRIDMTQRTDGDAKWVADAVVVAPNTAYTYTGYYQSNIATEIDLQYTYADGSVSYEFVKLIPASTSWQQLSADFTTPATAAKVVVLHIVAQPGWLQTDDFSLQAAQAPQPQPEPTPSPQPQPTPAPEPQPAPTPQPTPQPAPTPTPQPEPQPQPTDQDNLIPNNSFETASGTSPANWQTNAWGGTAAQFTYETSGRTGSHSATVTVTNPASGDAKWYAQPVAVQAGKTYIYRDYYKATVSTRVVAAYLDTAGAYSYAEIGSAPASTDWQQYQTTFKAPATAVQVTIFHLLDHAGSLTIDDVLLQIAIPAATGPSVPNASLETADGTGQPASWHASSWGTNQPSFAYVNDAHTGSKSAKVTMNNYTDGDAKWYFEPVTTLQPGQQYRFSAWYKTNVTPQAVAMFLKADGTESYAGMPAPQPSANSASQWQAYSDTLIVPANAVAVSVFLLINQNGWLQTDDYSLNQYHPNGFNRPLLTLTFDEGHEDNVTTALPLLNQYGFKTTQCYATTFIEGNAQAVQDVKAFQNSGHEICSHTVTHPFLTGLDSTQLQYELQHSQQYLQSITGVTIDDFASPYGDYNATVNTAIKQYYRSHRTVDEGFNSRDNFDPYRLRVQNILDTTTPEQVQQWIQQAQTDKTWLILVYHRVASNPGPYDTDTSVFAQQLQVIQESGITVKTYRDALNEVTGQL